MEMLEIHNLDEKTEILAARSRLKSSYFYFCEKRTPQGLAELLSQDGKYFKAEEAMVALREESKGEKGTRSS